MTVLRYLGYAAFFVLMFVVGLYVTFPWDMAKDRVLDMASKASGMVVTAEELSPSWVTGVRATKVKLLQPGSTEPLVVEELTARAKVLAFITGKKGGIVSLPLANGQIRADVTADKDSVAVKSDCQDVELGLIPGLAQAIGLPLTGIVDLTTDLTVGIEDPKLTNGTMTVAMQGLKLEKGGKISGFPVPELAIGDFAWQIPVEDGKATLQKLEIKGESVELQVDGTIQLMNPISRSNVNLTVAFKPTDKLLQAEPLLGPLLNNIQRAKGADGFYGYSVTGGIKAPRFFPKSKR